MPKRKHPSLAEHQAMGADLKDIRSRLLHLAIILPSCYPKASRTARLAQAALDAVEQLRCELDDRVVEENPAQETNVLLACYYAALLVPGGREPGPGRGQR